MHLLEEVNRQLENDPWVLKGILNAAKALNRKQKIIDTVNGWSTNTERSQINEKLAYTAMWIRDAIAWRSFGAESASEHLMIKDTENAVERMANRYTQVQLHQAWKEIETTRLAIDANASISLTLTALALKLNRTLK